MQSDVLMLQAWVSAVLVYPGLLFCAVLVLAGERVFAAMRPFLAPRSYRAQRRPYQILQPLYDFLKLSGRQQLVEITLASGGARPPAAGRLPYVAFAAVGAVAPVLALALLPFPGSPIAGRTGPVDDLLTMLLLLAVYPLCKATLRLGAQGPAALEGARDTGRVVAGLVPVLAAAAALAEAAGSRSIQLTHLSAAPETGAQALVRLLAGAVLLVALPWWLGRSGTHATGESAGTYAGGLLQRGALAAFWSVLVLPAPGETAWALVVAAGGALFAYLGMHVVEARWAPGMRPEDAARLLWATALPVAAVALIVALWSGAT